MPHAKLITVFPSTECGVIVHQGPDGAPYRAVPPTIWHKYGTVVADKYKPTKHVNYESRLLDSTDDLPKFKASFDGEMSEFLFICFFGNNYSTIVLMHI